MMAVVMAAGSSQSFRLFGARGALFTFNGSAGQANGLLRSAGLVHQQFYQLCFLLPFVLTLGVVVGRGGGGRVVAIPCLSSSFMVLNVHRKCMAY